MAKMNIHVLCSVVLSVVVAAQDQFVMKHDFFTADTIHDVLITNKIIPEVVDDFEPTIHPYLIYNRNDTVSLGNTIATSDASERPTFTLKKLGSLGHDPAKIYTLVLTDPDATSRANPKWSEMCHWVLTNISAPAQIDSNTWSSEVPAELIEYLAPAPPKKTGAHRYVFVLLEGTSTKLVGPRKRKHWGYKKVRHGVRDWAAENDLRVVGANFFFAQHKKQ